MSRASWPLTLALCVATGAARLVWAGNDPAAVAAGASPGCPRCAEWTVPQQPFRIFGNTYYVGTRALSSILITSSAGHILIDGTVPEAVPQLVANIRALGFRVEDVRLLLNSHDHFDHAGGLAALQRLSGAEVAARAPSARVLRQGHSDPDDPQYGSLARGPERVAHVRVIGDGETVSVGPLRLTAHATAGHTPGGTSWTWTSCESARCLHILYADSLSAISAPGFKFSANATYPNALQDFHRSFATLAALPCDILLTPHPEVSDTLARQKQRQAGAAADALVDPEACRRYARQAREDLETRVAQERSSP
jgi:metallo-beta-lactamase class B